MVLFLLALVRLVHIGSAIKCLSCNAVTSPSQCTNLVECGNQQCFINRFQTIGMMEIFAVGCDSTGVLCSSGGFQIIGKRQTSTGNLACCAEETCNEDKSILSYNVTSNPFTTTKPTKAPTTRPITTIPPMTTSPYTRCQDDPNSNCANLVRSAGSTVAACSNPQTSSSCKQTCGLCGKTGTKFYVDFTKMDGNSGAHIELLMVGMETGTFTVNIPYLNVSKTLPLTTGMNTFNVPKVIIPTNLHVEKKGVEVTSTVPMTMFAMNVEGANADGYAVIPLDKLGTEYLIPSTVGENELTILSPFDQTSVAIDLKMPLGNVDFNGQTYSNGDTIKVTLNKLDTLEVNAYEAYVGTKITSSKPIAVVSGDRCTGLEGVGCDHLLDMIPPTKSYSTNFIIPKLYDRKNSTVQIIASTSNTMIDAYEVNQVNPTHGLLANEGDHMDVVLGDLGVVSASGRVLVTMYVHACCAPVYHEPFMMVVPGIDRYLSEYDVAVWDGDNGFQNHLTVVIPQGNIPGLMLDNAQASPSTPLYSVTLQGFTYSVFGIRTSEGAHRMVHNKGVLFGLFVHGNTYSNGYGYAAGMRLD